MPLILAIEPDRRQATQLTAIVRGRLHAELVLGDSAEHALGALGQRIPDLILTSALLSPKDETALGERLRALDGAAAHVQTLTIPVLASASGRGAGKAAGMLSALRREKTKGSAPDGCDPAMFAEQCREYLARAAAEQELMAEQAAAAAERLAHAGAGATIELTPAAPESFADPAVAEFSEAIPQSTWHETTNEEPSPTARYESPRPAYEEYPAADAYVASAPDTRFAAPPPVDQTAPASGLNDFATSVLNDFTPSASRTYEAPAEFGARKAHDVVAPVNDFVTPAHDVVAPPNDFVMPANDDIAPANEVAAPAIEVARPAAGGFTASTNSFMPSPAETVKLSDRKEAAAPANKPRTPRRRKDPLVTENDGPASLLAAVAALSAEEAPDPIEPVKPAVLVHADEPPLPVAAAPTPALTVEPVLEEPPTASAAPAVQDSGDSRPAQQGKEWLDILEALRRDAEQIQKKPSDSPAAAAPPEPWAVDLFAASPFAQTPAAVPAAEEPPAAATSPETGSVPATSTSRASSSAPPGTSPAADAAPGIHGKPHAAATPAPAARTDADAAAAAHGDATNGHHGDAANGKKKRKKSKNGPAQDEWGFFDPEQCGFAALIEKLEEITDKDEKTPPRRA